MAASAVAGPSGTAIGMAAFLTVLFIWRAEVAYVYGLDPQDPDRLARLRGFIGEEPQQCMPRAPWHGARQVGRVGLKWLGCDLRLLAYLDVGGLLWNVLGPNRDQVWAARVMARVRGE